MPLSPSSLASVEPELSMIGLTNGLGLVEIFRFSVGWVGSTVTPPSKVWPAPGLCLEITTPLLPNKAILTN